MKYIVFENDGEIDAEAFSCFGVSAKIGDNPIGYFGTGLKYAIAIILREKCKIQLCSGLDVYNFRCDSKEIRGKSFEFIYANEERMAFTTELGKNWKLWQAYRELYSNAKDEGGSVYESDTLPEPQAGKTFVVVGGEGFVHCHENKGEIFCEDDSVVLSVSPVDLISGSGCFFSKGVKVWDFEGLPSLFSYNDRSGYCDLSEDRWRKYNHQVWKVIGNAIVQITDAEVLKQIIAAERGVVESQVDFDYASDTPSKAFIETAVRLRDKCNNKTLINYALRHSPKAPVVDKFLQPHEEEVLKESIATVKMAGYMVDEYPIRVVDRLDNNALGMAHDETIFLSYECFTLGGREMVKATLIEEWVHLKYGHDDCCYDMQNYLFSQIVRLVDINIELTKKAYGRAA